MKTINKLLLTLALTIFSASCNAGPAIEIEKILDLDVIKGASNKQVNRLDFNVIDITYDHTIRTFTYHIQTPEFETSVINVHYDYGLQSDGIYYSAQHLLAYTQILEVLETYKVIP